MLLTRRGLLASVGVGALGLPLTPLLTVNSPVPVRTVSELVAYAKANPAQANYARSSAAFQLATELFKMQMGAPLEHIAYKSSGAMLTAIVGGEVPMALADAPPVFGHLRAGKVRVLAVTAARRMAECPEVPTMAEAGIQDLEVRLWSGLFAPSATPVGTLKKLETEMMEILRLSDVRERLLGLSVDPEGEGAEAFTRLISMVLTRWAAIARAANIKFD